MAMDRIVALASAVSMAAIAVNTLNEFIKFVEEKQISNKTSLFSRQQSLPLPSVSNSILPRPSRQNSLEYTDNNVPRIDNDYPSKARFCRICGTKGYTEWHHIISQSYAKKNNQKELIRNPGNVVELCKPCHEKTPASMSWKYLSSKERKAKKKSRRYWW
jgi:5-methylcytosine-specific restriction endonuclease McrA